MDFENKLAELSAVVDKLENENLNIGTTIELYKKGLALCKECSQELGKLKGEITLLNNDFSLIDAEDEQSE